MAVELSYAKGSVKIAAAELGIDSGRLSKWRQNHHGSAVPGKKPTLIAEKPIHLQTLT